MKTSLAAIPALGLAVFLSQSALSTSSGLNHNRALAYGSVLMVNDFGHDPSDWLKIEAWGWCGGGSDQPVDDDVSDGVDRGGADGGWDPADPDNPDPPAPPPVPVCSWSVMYTTSYGLVVCPDGEAYIVRNGVGIDLTSSSEGSDFEWGEEVGCRGGSPAKPPMDTLSQGQGKPLLRALDPANVRRR